MQTAALARTFAFLVFAVACGAAAPDASITPPSKPMGPPTTSTDHHVFAVRILFLGDAPRDGGQPNSSAWAGFGYDLDGKRSTRSSTDVCTLANGPARVHDNGNGGIDNAFGAWVLPTLISLAGHDDFAGFNKDALAQGGPTVLLDTVGLSSAADQTNTGLTADVFTFNVGPRAHFADAYVVGGTWVSGPTSDSVSIRLVFLRTPGSSSPGLTVPFEVVVHHPVITFVHASAGKAAEGTIAGVLDVEEVVATVASVIRHFSTVFCIATAIDGFTNQFRGYADMLKDGTNAPGKVCDGISIGLGFEAEELGAPTSGAKPDAPPFDPCPTDAGVD